MQVEPLHKLTIPDVDSFAYAKARYHYLLQIIFGETIAIDYCRRMSLFAPTEEASKYLIQQQNEEDAHLDMLTTYVGVHPRPEVLISPSLKKLDAIATDTVNRKNYVEAIFVQNFIVEGLNVTLLKELIHHTDSNLSEMCVKILKDEVGHAEFGVTEMKRILDEDKSRKLRKRLIQLQRKTLFYSTGLALSLAREAKDLGIPMKEFAKRVLDEHLERVALIDLPLPFLDRLLFKFAIIFLSIVG